MRPAPSRIRDDDLAAGFHAARQVVGQRADIAHKLVFFLGYCLPTNETRRPTGIRVWSVSSPTYGPRCRGVAKQPINAHPGIAGENALRCTSWLSLQRPCWSSRFGWLLQWRCKSADRRRKKVVRSRCWLLSFRVVLAGYCTQAATKRKGRRRRPPRQTAGGLLGWVAGSACSIPPDAFAYATELGRGTPRLVWFDESKDPFPGYSNS